MTQTKQMTQVLLVPHSESTKATSGIKVTPVPTVAFFFYLKDN